MTLGNTERQQNQDKSITEENADLNRALDALKSQLDRASKAGQSTAEIEKQFSEIQASFEQHQLRFQHKIESALDILAALESINTKQKLVSDAFGKDSILILKCIALDEGLDGTVRQCAVNVMPVTSTSAAQVIPVLLEIMKTENLDVYSAVCQAIGEFGKEALHVLPEVINEMKDENRGARALDAVHGMGESALPLLIEALGNQHPCIREHAAWGISELGIKAAGAVPSLIKLLGDESQNDCLAAIHALGTIGKKAVVAQHILLEKLKSGDDAVCRATLETLGSIRASADEALPCVIGFTSNTNWALRCEAVEAIAKIAPRNRDVALILIKSLNDENAVVRRDSALAMRSINVPSEKNNIIVGLMKCLNDEDYQVRDSAAETLGKKIAASALNDLKSRLQIEGNLAVKETLKQAIKKIESQG